LEEAKDIASTREWKREKDFIKMDRAEALSAIADIAESGKDIPEALLEQYVKQGGSMRGINRAIRQEILSRNMTYKERQMVGRNTPARARERQVMEK
jgi:hypothetical protein